MMTTKFVIVSSPGTRVTWDRFNASSRARVTTYTLACPPPGQTSVTLPTPYAL